VTGVLIARVSLSPERMRRLVAFFCSLALVLMAAAPSDTAGPGKLAAIPDDIKVPDGHVLLFAWQAEGVQIYVSEPDGDGFKWTFKSPLADLLDKDKIVGYHFGILGNQPVPAWESKDGSKVVRDLKVAISPAKSPDGESNIPWLLIKVNADAKKGVLSSVTYIQRINTQGGVAPAARPTRAGTEIGVKYKATYNFYAKKSK
jgi:hypothetical protein